LKKQTVSTACHSISQSGIFVTAHMLQQQQRALTPRLPLLMMALMILMVPSLATPSKLSTAALFCIQSWNFKLFFRNGI
jgi:hypothetical protein